MGDFSDRKSMGNSVCAVLETADKSEKWLFPGEREEKKWKKMACLKQA